MSTAGILSSNGVAVYTDMSKVVLLCCMGSATWSPKKCVTFPVLYRKSNVQARRKRSRREGHNRTALDEPSDLLLVVRPVLPCLSSTHGIRPSLFVLCADEVEAAVNVMLIYATASKNGLWSKYNLEEP